MSFPNSTLTDLVVSTLEARGSAPADNVSDNNALLAWIKKNGGVRTISGGRTIYEEIAFAENGNGGSYSGYDTLPTAASDVLSGAEFAIKQYAVPVVISGLEMLQNSGKEQVFDLLEGRIKVAESTLMNLLHVGAYSDGTANGGKVITGLGAAVPTDPTTGTYGGINRATAGNEFWRSQLEDTTTTSSSIQAALNSLYAKCQRGADHPDLMLFGTTKWKEFLASLQTLQRFTSDSKAKLGFETIKYLGADCVLDGGIGGNQNANNVHALNTKYLFWRPHAKRNCVPINPEKRYAINQDASVTIIGFAGNMTSSGPQFCGLGTFD